MSKFSSTSPSWVSDPELQLTTTNNDVPSWLCDDVQGAGTLSPDNGELQLTAVQYDGISEPMAASTSTTITNTDTNTNTTAIKSDVSHAQIAAEKTWGQFWSNSFQRDGRTLLITIIVIVLMNVPYVQWALYPFSIFTTWIHELCHGLAAIMVGGKIQKLEIFSDTSGLATFTLSNTERFPFVASAGYQGTPVIGMLLLLLRRTKRGPRAGTMAIALMMFASVALWIRNAFGVVFILGLAGLLFAAGIWLPSWWIRNFYVLLAVTCALNSIGTIRALFGDTQEVNGQALISDAHAMENAKGGSHTMWATVWLFLALGLLFLGMIFPIPGPDESADFTLCGLCQDMGCFFICNAKGKRLFSTLVGREGQKADTLTETNHTNNV